MIDGSMWQLVVAGLTVVFCGFYLWEVAKSYGRRAKLDLDGVEGFDGSGGAEDVRVDDKCYDRFYAKVYDPLVQPTARAGLETQLPLEWFKKEQGREPGVLRVADIGSGTGLHVELFARQGVHSVIGIDRSPDMVLEAGKKYPERQFLVGDVTVATTAAAEQFDLVTMYYFTLYTIPDRTAALKNIYLWLAPGGLFCVHLVNKLKFDPVLESASPFVGFSVQKYADERVTTSRVAFDEFDYEGDFQLHGSRGMFEESFKFKDGRVRKHEQRVWMPNIDDIVNEIGGIGFKYVYHADLTAIGYEYNYLFFFQR